MRIKALKVRRRGFSVPELLVVSAIFAGFLTVSYMLLNSGLGVWKKTAGSQEVDLELLKARDMLRRDLTETSFTKCRVSDFPALESTSNSGDVVWMLSAEQPTTGEMARNTDGVPFWQRNVVYYAVVPSEHDKLYGSGCPGSQAECPHKFLMRRVIDGGPVTRPASPIKNQERLLDTNTLLPLLVMPATRRDVPGADEFTEVVASGLLDFKVSLAPEAEWPEEVRVELVALPTQIEGKRLELGSQDPRRSNFAHSLIFSVKPENTGE